ncbi:hypothetical protein AMS68_005666 [Peltaster fructicola]|uniref:MPN domain-containing protein n=1 Tax=Peltaster fructicola TaxID=286661 RepID=A0A6H0XZV4_9PEZI|nr:hypothetical protein AMS68_005666 [Peltaster fructicola]
MASRRQNEEVAPKSIAEITEEATNFDFYVERPLKSWLQSARVLQSQATSCEKGGDIELAYLYSYRLAILILEKLPQYPAAERARYKDEIAKAKRQVNKNFSKLEAWKPQLQRAYDQALLAIQTYKTAANRQTQQRHQNGDFEAFPGFSDTFDYEQRRSLDALENRQLALDLSQQELERRGHYSRGDSVKSKAGVIADDDLARRLQETRQLLEQKSSGSSNEGAASRLQARYNYPEVPHHGSNMSWSSSPPRVGVARSSPPPLLPAKVSATQPTSTPPVPRKESVSSPTVKFKVKAYTEGGHGLRSLLLPSKLAQHFLNLADSNTARDLETCGVLCASLVSNALIITHLIIPDQTSTSDTCDTTDAGDSALFDYCDQHDLLVCGWIHTHPSQTCFLSSRDLHTSSGYQQMLAEAIAIVCAPATIRALVSSD